MAVGDYIDPVPYPYVVIGTESTTYAELTVADYETSPPYLTETLYHFTAIADGRLLFIYYAGCWNYTNEAASTQGTAYVKIYKNGNPYGLEHSIPYTEDYPFFVDIIDFEEGDEIEFYGKYVGGLSGDAVEVAQIFAFDTNYIYGITRDANGDPIGNCIVNLHLASTSELVQSIYSNSDGSFAFYVGDSVTEYFIIAFGTGVQGITDDNLTGVA